MKFLISIALILRSTLCISAEHSQLASIATLNPNAAPGKFILQVKDYEDQRFDIDLDGDIDFWRLRQNDIQIDISFEGKQVKDLFIRKLTENSAIEVFYKRNGNSLGLHSSQVRPKFNMSFSEDDNCPSSAENLKKELEVYKNIKEIPNQKITEELIEPSCKNVLGSKYGSLNISLRKFLSGSDLISTCIDRPDFKNQFPKGPQTDLSVEVLRTAYQLERAKLSKATKDHSPLILCKVLDEGQSMQPGISTEEGGKITIAVSDVLKKFDFKPKHLDHEMLHKIGLFSEASVNKVVEACNKLESDPSLVAGTGQTGVSLVPSSTDVGNEAQKEITKEGNAKLDAASNQTVKNEKKGATEVANPKPVASADRAPASQQSSINANAQATANIPKSMTVAQTKVPSSEALSETIYTNHQKTDAGISNAYDKSKSQSSGILATANNIAGAMNTQASASLAQAKNQAREIASTAKAAGSSTDGSGSGSAGGLISRNRIGSNEKVVESITLDSQQPTISARADATASQTQNNRQPASDSRTLPSSTETSSGTIQAAGLNAARSDSGQAQVNPVGSNQQVSLGASNQNAQRQPANVVRGGGGTGGAASPSPDEIITFISQADYQQTKQRLSDPRFIRQLDESKVRIIDTSGNAFGARNPKVNFLDDGVQFVKQNK